MLQLQNIQAQSNREDLLVEVEQKLVELQSQAKHVTEVTARLNDPKSQWEYKDVEDINLIHFHN